MGSTVIGILFALIILGAKLYGEKKEKEAESAPPGKEGNLRDEIERRLRRLEEKAGSLLDDYDEKAPHTAAEKLEKPDPIPIRPAAMTSYLHPEYEGTAEASTAMQPKTAEAEDHLEIQVLGETDAANREPLLPESPQAKAALLRKGIVLKEILDRRY